MNYYEHHLGDYAEATAHLSLLEDAVYSRCIRKYYASEQPLPADVSMVQRLVGARSKEEKICVEAILKEFFILTDDGWHNARCDEELERYQSKQTKARASAEARWNKTDANAMRTHTERKADAVPTQCEGNALQSPVSSNQSPVTKKREESERATRLPDDWPLTDFRFQIAEVERVDPIRTHAKFCDHWRAANGSNARKRDWDAAWRNWCRTEADRIPKPNGHAIRMQPMKLMTAEEAEAMERARGETHA